MSYEYIIKHDLNNNKTEKFKVKKTNKQYNLKKLNKNGSENFHTNTKKIKYDNVIYYDIETVKAGEKFDDEKFETLNLSKNILYSFSLLIPKNKQFNANISTMKEFYYKKFDEENREVFKIIEKEDYYLIFSYSEDTQKNLFDLIEILTFFKNNNILKLVGFNNNKFDDLIFKHLDSYNMLRNERNKYNQLIIKLSNNNDFKINFFDLIDLAKSFRLLNLKAVGEYLNIEKLNMQQDNLKTFKEQMETYIAYNNRDNEILYYFLKEINEKLGIYETNVARFSRKFFLESMFKKLNVDYINSNAHINEFNLYGGRTEAYTYKSENVKYLDFNSLYTSSRTVLDIVVPNITSKKGKKKEDKERVKADFYLNKLSIFYRVQYIINSIKIDLFDKKIENYTYPELAKLYDKYAKDKFFMLKVRLKNIDEFFENKKSLLLFYFPFIRKHKDKSSFSFDTETVYEISFYEVIFLAFFDFEIVEAYITKKGEDILKDDLIEIYENRKVLKDKNDKREALEKLKLNAGYGIFATKNTTSEKILDKRIIKGIDNFLQNDENTLNTEIKEKIDNITDNLYFSFGIDRFKIKVIAGEYFKINESAGKKWTDNSIPIIALNIVSNSRFMLYSIILDYIMNSDEEVIKIHYCDTDSIFCDTDIYERLKAIGLIGNKLGQLKDELPDKKIISLKCFAPKTYIYNLDDGTEKRTFKGTGTNEYKTIISQSLKSRFTYNNRVALNPETEQKRLLKGNIFYNNFGVSEDLKTVWNEQLNIYAKRKEEERLKNS